MSSNGAPELPGIPERTDPVIARLVVADANHAHGTFYRLVESMNAGFQAGTWLLHNGVDEHERAVLKWSSHRGSAPRLLRAADAVERAKDAGYPVPAWLAVGVAKAGFPYHIQQYVQGSSPRRLTAEVAERLLPVLEQQCGLDIDPEHAGRGVRTEPVG